MKPMPFAWHRPHGVPRGLLYAYILHRIAGGPTHGYEILNDIEEKTQGAWRPGPGSLYPILKRLLSEELIQTDHPKHTATEQKVYRITTKGAKRLDDMKSMFANAGQRWRAVQRIFLDLIDPADLNKFVVDGSKFQFEMTREILQLNFDKLTLSDTEYILKEYALNLERQVDWAKETLDKLKKHKSTHQVSQVMTIRK